MNPILERWLEEMNKGCDESNRKVEVIMVSCDNSEEEFKEHLKEVSWPAIAFESKQSIELEDMYEVEAIPILLLVRKDDGQVVNDNVRAIVLEGTENAYTTLIESLG